MIHAEIQNTKVNNVDEEIYFETYLIIKLFLEWKYILGTSYKSIDHYIVLDRIDS